jgi:hypothetical protein
MTEVASILGAPAFELLHMIRPVSAYSTEYIVDMYRGLRISIFFDEHPPPHFAVTYNGETASFSITECRRLKGNKGLERHESSIRKWWSGNRPLLVSEWNRSRPTDCTVGPVDI